LKGKEPKSGPDFDSLSKAYQVNISDEALTWLSESLKVTEKSLKRLHVGWDGQAYTFPMSNDFGKRIGIRRRLCCGKKLCVKGSQTGLFIPSDLLHHGPLLILEGESDTAAALDLGFDAVGRAGCHADPAMMGRFCKDWDEVIIMGDNDGPGRSGATRLAAELILHCASVKIVYPEYQIKDLRAWLIQGGITKERVLQLGQRTNQGQIRLSMTSVRGSH
jgi:hypothetical protein